MVGCNGYRNPALYAKIASTVDVASHGRLYAGIGAGWYEHEWKAYGYEWPTRRSGWARFREAVQIIHKMWTEDTRTSTASTTRSTSRSTSRRACRSHTFRFWIGGGGEQVTLKLVAQYADACNVGGGKPDVAKAKLDVLATHCENENRDLTEIIKCTSMNIYLLANGEDPKAGSRPSWPDTRGV